MSRKYREYDLQAPSGHQVAPKTIKEFVVRMSNKILDLQSSGIEVSDSAKETVRVNEIEINSLRCELQG